MLPTNSGSARCLIPIQIETLAGTSFELLVSSTEQIQYIKRKIERREGIPMNHQHLIWKSTELDDESCLNDYHIEAGTTIKLVLAMRGGPVNTRRIPIEDNLIRDVSEYMESAQDDYGTGNDLLPSSNKNVTFLVLRDGDQFNFFQVIDRGDGTLSPLSGSMSANSMYNTHETLTVESEREHDEKRRADDQKTKQKMEQIRSKLKTHMRKDILVSSRPSSSTKQTKSNLIHHHRRTIRVDTSSNISTNGDNSSGTSSLEQQCRPLPYNYATTNLFNPFNLLAANGVHQNDLLHEEDSDDDDDDDDDSHDDDDDDDDDEQKQQTQVFVSRSFSPSIFYSQAHSKDLVLKPSTGQYSVTPTTTSVTDVNSNAGLVDYRTHLPAIVTSDTPPVSNTQLLSDQSGHFTIEGNTNRASDNIHSSPSGMSVVPELTNNQENRTTMHSMTSASPSIMNNTHIDRKTTADTQSRNDTALSRALWTDEDETINTLDEYKTNERVSTSRSMLLRHQKCSTNASGITQIPTLPSKMNKSSLPATTTQPFYHNYKSLTTGQQPTKSSPRPLMPLSLSKYRRIPANMQTSNSSKQQTWIGTGQNSSNMSINAANNPSTNSLNESFMLSRRLETFKTPAKQSSSQSTLPTSSSTTPLILPPPAPTKRFVQQQELKTTGTMPSTPTSTMMPLDNTKVTIETIGSKTVSALLRQNATIEPVDTSRGVGKHLVSLLTSASKDSTSNKTTHSKSTSQDVVIEERLKLDSKLNNTWSNSTTHNALTTSNTFQLSTTGIYNSNKLPSVTVNRKSTTKCFLCKKKTGLATTYQCRCGSSFCSEHRYPESHACAFDYKAEGKRLIERNNPLVTAPKLPKI